MTPGGMQRLPLEQRTHDHRDSGPIGPDRPGPLARMIEQQQRLDPCRRLIVEVLAQAVHEGDRQDPNAQWCLLDDPRGVEPDDDAPAPVVEDVGWTVPVLCTLLDLQLDAVRREVRKRWLAEGVLLSREVRWREGTDPTDDLWPTSFCACGRGIYAKRSRLCIECKANENGGRVLRRDARPCGTRGCKRTVLSPSRYCAACRLARDDASKKRTLARQRAEKEASR